MCPALVLKEGKLVLVTGSPGGRTIPNTVLWTILGVIDFDLDAQAAVDRPRAHHQWLPDVLTVEASHMGPAIQEALKAMGHTLKSTPRMGVAQIIKVRPDGKLEGGADTLRWGESAAVGY